MTKRHNKLKEFANRYEESNLSGEVLTLKYVDGTFSESIPIDLSGVPQKLWPDCVIKTIVKFFYEKGKRDKAAEVHSIYDELMKSIS